MKNWQKIATRLIVLVFVVGLFVSQAVPVFAVTRDLYWVGNGGNWSDTAHWSLADDGAGGEAVPDTDDNVNFTANSFKIAAQTMTLNADGYCQNFDASGVANSPTFRFASSSNRLFYVYGDLTFAAGSTVTSSEAGVPINKCTIYFQGGTDNVVDFAGHKFYGIVINKTAGFKITANSDFDGETGQGGGTITFSAGDFDSNGQIINYQYIIATGAAVRNIDFSTSTVTSYYNALGNYFNFSGTNIALTATAADFFADVQGGTNHSYFSGGGYNYGDLTLYVQSGLDSTDSQPQMAGQNTFTNLTILGQNVTGGTGLYLTADQTVSGTFTTTGYNSYSKRLTIKSNNTTGREINVTGAHAITNTNLAYIYAGGPLIDWDISAGLNYDLGHNLHILFSTGGTMYWVGNTGSTSDINHWASTSGGPAASAPRLPTLLDTIIFDANSVLLPGRTVTFDYTDFGTINASAIANTPVFTGSVRCYGSFSVGAASTWNSAVTMSNRLIPSTFATASTLNGAIVIDTDGMTVTVASNSVIANSLTLTSGYLDLNGYSITAYTFASDTTTYDRAIHMGSGTFTLNGTAAGTKWHVHETNFAMYCETSTIVLTSTGVNAQTFSPGTGQTFNGVTITGTGAYTMTVDEAATFGTLTITRDSVKTVKFPTSKTTTITGDFIMTPSGVVVLTLVGTTAPPTANVWTVSKATGFVGTDYLSLEDSTALGGAVFYAGSHSTFVSHVTGWLNSDPTAPAVTTVAASSITGTSAVLNGNLTSIGGYSPVYVYFEWGYTTSYGYTTAEITKTAIGVYDTTITITPATTYHYRAAVRYGGTLHTYGLDATVSPSTSGGVFTPLPAVPNKNRDAFIPTGGTDTFLPADAAMAGTGVPGYVLVHLLATTGFAGNDAMAWAVFILILGTAIGMLAGIYLRRAIVVGVCFSMFLTIFLFIGVVPLGWAIVSWILTLEMGIAEARSG